MKEDAGTRRVDGHHYEENGLLPEKKKLWPKGVRREFFWSEPPPLGRGKKRKGTDAVFGAAPEPRVALEKRTVIELIKGSS